jgi:F0F1-type ATP synthase membrane subunit b/b'
MPEEATAAPAEETAPVIETPAPQVEQPAQSVDQLPEWAQKEIAKVRKEAGDYRTKAQTAAEQAQKELTDKLAVALGLKKDAAADPAALTASLTAAQEKANQSARELAIFKSAAATGADPSRLLDSNSFMSSVAGLDPSDGAAISAAITAAIAANPLLKAVQAAAASGTELGGTGEQGQITEAQLAQMSPEQINKALREGKLAHLL